MSTSLIQITIVKFSILTTILNMKFIITFLLLLGVVQTNATNVTFSIDVNNEDVEGQTIYLVGSFTGWEWVSMSDDNADGIYEVTYDVDEGDHSFKYLIGGWEQQEDMSGAGCSLNSDRMLTVSGTDPVVLATEIFNQCSSPIYPSVTFKVDMTGVAIHESGVQMRGVNGDWDNAVTLSDENSDNIYEVTRNVENGSSHSYLFTNGDWEDGRNDCVEGKDRKLKVYNEDITLDPVTYGVCSDKVNVTFSVDMGERTSTNEAIYMTGLFGWGENNVKLYDLEGDNIWEATVQLNKNTTYTYNYIDDNWEDDRELCPEGKNREIVTEESHMVLPTVNYGECEVPLVYVDVTFQVDMNAVELVDDRVFIVELNGQWEPEHWVEMLDENADGIYTATVGLPEGTQKFRYNNGVNWNDEDLSDEPCAVEGDKNRSLTVVSDGSENPTQLLDVVSYNSCTAEAPEALFKEVTFVIDASGLEDTSEGLYIAASWNGWNPENFTAMTDENNDNIWEVTVELEAGKTHEYKYTLGSNWDNIEDMLNAGCEYDGTNNRFVELENTEEGIVLDTVSFNSCSSSEVVWSAVTFKIDVSQMASESRPEITGSWSDNSLEMIPLGAGVYAKTIYLRAQQTYTYTYSIDENVETVDGGCVDENNQRSILVENDSILTPYIFNTCDESQQEIEGSLVDVTFRVNRSKERPSEQGVYLAGSWASNDWNVENFDALTDDDGDGIWEVTVALVKGESYEYQFTIDRDWNDLENLEGSGCEVEGTSNRGITVGDEAVVLDAVCFNECSACFFNVTNISVTGSNITEKGGTAQMLATIVPLNANIQDVTWSVSDHTIASINAEGLLTAITDGNVKVTATTTEEGSVVAGSLDVVISGQIISAIDANVNALIKIYPNPSNGLVNVNATFPIASITIFDLNGRIVQEIKLDEFVQKNIQINNLRKGVYLIKVSNNELIGLKKVIIN